LEVDVKIKRLQNIVVAAAFCCLFVIPGMTQAESTDKTTLKVRGATTVASLISNWAKDFEGSKANTSIVLYGSTHGDGFKALLNKETDVLMAARKLSEDERSQAKNKNIELREAFLENDAVAIVVHPDNPVNELTMDQLTKIFTGDYSNWKQVGGADESILLITMPPDSGMRSFLSKDIIKGNFAYNALEEKSITRILSMVRPRPGAITYCRTELAFQGEIGGTVKCLALKPNPESPAIKLSEESVVNGSFPITRALCLYYDARDHNPVAEEFAQFCADRAKEKIKKASAAVANKREQ
jgi:phosphate transport system substrate-binding protein